MTEMSWEIRGVQVVLPDRLLPNGIIRTRGERIVFVGEAGGGEDGAAAENGSSGGDLPEETWSADGDSSFAEERPRVIDARALGPDLVAIPGMIDLHVHGADGADVMDGTPEALRTIARALLREGTTAFCATTMSASEERLVRALRNVAASFDAASALAASAFSSQGGAKADGRTPEAIEQAGDRAGEAGAALLGVHLEGPFLHPDRAGAQPVEALRAPSLAAFRRLNEAAGGRIRLITLAPELPGALELIPELVRAGVVVSVGHTDADYETVVAAADRGARHVTHVFNAMRPLHHRAPGALGAALVDERLTVELIADGVHVHPALFRLVFRAKGTERVVLITDGIRAKGRPDGVYELGGREVTVRCGRATLADGTLAGSVLRMNEALKHLVDAGIPLTEAVRAATLNPARALGLDGERGALLPGRLADVVLLDGSFAVRMVWVRGRLVHIQA
ncbi:N-acetylglucosamine-6-phosphate deacetylase [Hydrogenibacillus sp. N12]|uniref:N-acetylglucosamine-6-phosphate deacetylase n=1 Tax=Hydrogenibacillus sp. N12 TaxID=2866627 RepID=UPI001C7CB16D|nr:N-acetylglucosamine-6-phosphate deacetylase [Hydrogenibacillus sp. N12]QZA33683.1 N-acetylglucosamine-6-phosphate deacetylase [Hydrogenibacillus sp. N12]